MTFLNCWLVYILSVYRVDTVTDRISDRWNNDGQNPEKKKETRPNLLYTAKRSTQTIAHSTATVRNF